KQSQSAVLSGAKRCGATDLEVYATSRTGIVNDNRRAGCGGERTPYLENEVRIRCGPEIESEYSCQLSRRGKTVHTRSERHTTQILTSQGEIGRQTF